MYGLCKLYSLGKMGESWRKSCGKRMPEGEKMGKMRGEENI